MRRYSLILILFLQHRSWSQQKDQDSALKTVHLQEVSIYDENSRMNQSFSFYRNNKLATTEDILSRMQGVNLIKRGAYGLEPTLRNYGSGQTNLTIDGMRMYGACTDKMDPVSIYIEPNNLKSIQVSQGAAGALDGSTIGGQINMRTREPEFNCHPIMSGQASTSYLSVNQGLNSSLSLEQTLGKVAYRLSGTYRHANDYKAGSDSLIPHSGYEKANTSVCIVFKTSERQNFKLDYLGDWGHNIGYPALPMDVGKATAGIYALTHRYAIKGKALSSNEFKAYYNSVYHQMDDTHRPESPMHMDMPGWSQTIGAYNELRGKHDLKLRIDFHQAYTKADMTMYPKNEPLMYLQTLPENTLNDFGFAAGRSFHFKQHQQIDLNLRVDYFSQSAFYGPGANQWKVFNQDVTQAKTNFLKNMNLAYSGNLGKHTGAQFSMGYGERIPTSNERYGFYLYNRQDQFDYLGNPDLKPERSLQAELLVKEQFKWAEFSLNLFYHHVYDYIYAYQLEGYSQMTIGAKGLKTYRNIEYADNRGFEASLKLNLGDYFSYLGNAKFVYAQTYDGKPLPLVPPFKLQEALRCTYKLYQFQLEHDFGAAQNRVNSDYGDKVTPSFNLINLRASRNIPIRKCILQVALACENVFDLLYHEHLDIGGVPRFGRNVLCNISLVF
ncbi:MAG TPA: TonB-dependent receptor [Bacteroidia bacterium]|nr:TonB-dependent receptor [Bacteroidia bacterium]